MNANIEVLTLDIHIFLANPIGLILSIIKLFIGIYL